MLLWKGVCSMVISKLEEESSITPGISQHYNSTPPCATHPASFSGDILNAGEVGCRC